MSRRKSTRKTPSKRAAEEEPEQEAEANESVDNKQQEMVSVSRRELDLLRSIQAEWEKAQPLVQRQPEMLQTLKEKTDLAVGARENENKQLKAEVAHYKAAAAEASEQAATQREVLKLLEALTNTTFREEDGGKFLCTSKNLDLSPAMSFHLSLDDAGTAHYDPVSLVDAAPDFFRDSISFSRGQAVIFFREVLKLLSREK